MCALEGTLALLCISSLQQHFLGSISVLAIAALNSHFQAAGGEVDTPGSRVAEVTGLEADAPSLQSSTPDRVFPQVPS